MESARSKCPFMSGSPTPPKTDGIPGEQPTLAEYCANALHNKRANIESKSCCSRVVQIRGHNKRSAEGSHVILTLEDNYYIVEFAFKAEYDSDCCKPYVLELVNYTKSEVLAAKKAWPCTRTSIRWEGVLTKDTVLIIKVLSKKNKICTFKLIGSIDIDQNQYDRRLELLRTTAFDIDLNIQYIPSQPADQRFPAPPFKDQWPNKGDVFPWNSINIPWKKDQTSLPEGTSSFPNNNWYDKFQSIQYSVFFYLGVDMFTVEPNSPTITIFIKNFLDRGYNNYLKKVYMFALRCENMQYYAEKIDKMLNEALVKFTSEGAPVVSSFKSILIDFFLAMHVGGQAPYPSEVVEFFQGFIDVVGFGDPNREGRFEIILRGNELAQGVKDYFSERNKDIVSSGDKTCLLYWWNLAGLDQQSLLIEAVHNIVAFSQYVNVFFKAISDKLWWQVALDGGITYLPPGNPPTIPPNTVIAPKPEWWWPISPIPIYRPDSNVGPVNFFKKITEAGTDTEKIKVAFELYRLMNTNTNAFSKLMPISETDTKVQARHIWQSIMIANQGKGPLNTFNFFTYGSLAYEEENLNYDCPATPFPPAIQNINPEEFFVQSPIDGTPDGDGTVLDKHRPNLIPVFDTPVYLPMGVGYRRCAGEILNYLFAVKLLDKFKDVEWEVRDPPINPKTSNPYTQAEYFEDGLYQTIAPFLAVPNTIFAVKPEPFVPPVPGPVLFKCTE